MFDFNLFLEWTNESKLILQEIPLSVSVCLSVSVSQKHIWVWCLISIYSWILGMNKQTQINFARNTSVCLSVSQKYVWVWCLISIYSWILGMNKQIQINFARNTYLLDTLDLTVMWKNLEQTEANDRHITKNKSNWKCSLLLNIHQLSNPDWTAEIIFTQSSMRI